MSSVQGSLVTNLASSSSALHYICFKVIRCVTLLLRDVFFFFSCYRTSCCTLLFCGIVSPSFFFLSFIRGSSCGTNSLIKYPKNHGLPRRLESPHCLSYKQWNCGGKSWWTTSHLYICTCTRLGGWSGRPLIQASAVNCKLSRPSISDCAATWAPETPLRRVAQHLPRDHACCF